jgi:hypothetical protein
VAFSPDGIRWTKYSGNPVHRTSFGAKLLDPPFEDEGPYLEQPPRKSGNVPRIWRVPHSMSDALDVLYDARLGVFVGYGKMWTPWPDGTLAWKHAMGRMDSKDFIHWSKPELVASVNDRDAVHHEALRFRATQRPVEVGGVTISPGHVLHADPNGVIRTPGDCLHQLTGAAVRNRAFEHEAHAFLRRTDKTPAEKRAHVQALVAK